MNQEKFEQYTQYQKIRKHGGKTAKFLREDGFTRQGDNLTNKQRVQRQRAFRRKNEH